MRSFLVLSFLVIGLAEARTAETLDLATVNSAELKSQNFNEGTVNPVIVKAQILLDRARFSPGEIDGKAGENFKKALVVFEAEQGLPATGKLSEGVWQKLTATSSDPVLETYTLSNEDLRGPFVKSVPKKMEDMKDLPSLDYTSPQEKLAEKFHMSEELLGALNPGVQFDTAGRSVVVASKVAGELPAKVARLEVDKSRQTVKVFDQSDKLLAVFPATVGSTEKPAPSGRLKVRVISKKPTYRYNPDYAFKGVRSTQPFTIKPGPNNPVGAVWIGLSPGEGFGIHGTPDPSKVSKSESHGCVRLTNWDALTLATALTKGAIVEFYGDEQDRQQRKSKAKKSRSQAL
jgi:lipoprotein-anchoring transpeptidase ErfK/SrfK